MDVLGKEALCSHPARLLVCSSQPLLAQGLYSTTTVTATTVLHCLHYHHTTTRTQDRQPVDLSHKKQAKCWASLNWLQSEAEFVFKTEAS